MLFCEFSSTAAAVSGGGRGRASIRLALSMPPWRSGAAALAPLFQERDGRGVGGLAGREGRWGIRMQNFRPRLKGREARRVYHLLRLYWRESLPMQGSSCGFEQSFKFMLERPQLEYSKAA